MKVIESVKSNKSNTQRYCDRQIRVQYLIDEGTNDVTVESKRLILHWESSLESVHLNECLIIEKTLKKYHKNVQIPSLKNVHPGFITNLSHVLPTSI